MFMILIEGHKTPTGMGEESGPMDVALRDCMTWDAFDEYCLSLVYMCEYSNVHGAVVL